MTQQHWRRGPDVAWTGDAERVIAARTSPPDPDGPRVLEGSAAWVWLALSEPATAEQLVALALGDGAPETAQADVGAALASLNTAGLTRPA
ncbi:MAG: PqqD family protein [Aeromicrobium sp.]